MKEKLREPLHTAIKVIFEQVKLLQRSYGKNFTPGDKLIGDAGEAIAEMLFEIEPLDPNTKGHDYRCRKTHKKVQIKTTSGNRLGLGQKKTEFEHLVAIKIYPDGTFEILYNGEGHRVAKRIEKNSSPSIQIAALRELNTDAASEALKRRLE